MANLKGSKQKTYARKEPPNKIRTREDEIKMVEAYLEGKSPEYIRVVVLGGKFKTDKSITDALKKLGVYEKRTKDFYSQTKNHSYFKETTTEEQAYFLGLMQSDGWLHFRSNNCKQVGLCLEEDYIIQKFKDELQTENTITIRQYPNGRKTLYQLLINSTFLYDDLYKFGVGNKFIDQYMPILDEKLINHYVRGLFDGDGTVHIHEETKNIHIGFIGGLKTMSQISFYLAYKLGIYQTQPILMRDKCFGEEQQQLFGLRYADKKEVDKIYNFLYKNATIYIKRKKEVFEEWFDDDKN